MEKVKELSVSLEGKSDAEKRELLVKCASTSLNSKLVRTLLVFLGGCYFVQGYPSKRPPAGTPAACALCFVQGRACGGGSLPELPATPPPTQDRPL